ncbi:MAG: hypothetical protein PF479_04405, partial [Oceanispirochaeta sp.]|nr:hypothetical protein [Oceanispirochaeta sp.]
GGGCGGSGSGGNGSQNQSELSSFFENPIPEIPDTEITLATRVDGIQQVEVSVTERGFEPAVIVIEKGVLLNWTFKGVEINEKNYRVYFPAYGYQGMEFKEGNNTINLEPETDFAWYSWKNDFGGFVKVVDDLDSADLEAIRKDVQLANDQN